MVNTSGLPEIASPGILVRNTNGRLGIKGRIPVMWEGMGYSVAEWPEDLERASK